MGCMQTKKDCSDIHPNVFRVVNIDESGTNLWSGQLEITDDRLVLYREGRDATVWPLHCLRRYGFDGEIFSFESGRRCDTGEGIYAFRCRRAGMLFRTLQQNIQQRNRASNSFQLSSGTATTLPRSLSGDSTAARRASAVGDLGSDQPPPTATRPNISSRSLSDNAVHEVLPLFPTNSSDSPNHVTNCYQKENLRAREFNNNKSASEDHSYCNDFNRDLANLRSTLKKEYALSNLRELEEERNLVKCLYVNEEIVQSHKPPKSPANKETNNDALLAQQNTNDRIYMNLTGDGASSDIFLFPDPLPKEPTPVNTYVNVNIGDFLQRFPKVHQHINTAVKFTESVTVEGEQVNYAVLDIDPAMSPDSCAISAPHTPAKFVTQGSLDSPALVPGLSVGYTTIDFDKTVALTSVASGTVMDNDGCRRTRHDSINVSSPGCIDKNKLN